MKSVMTIKRRRFLQGLATVAGAGVVPALAQQGAPAQVFTVAGTGSPGYEPEPRGGARATESPINNPYGVVIGPDNALYFCEVDSGYIRRLNVARNLLSTIAGTGEPGYRPESRLPLETPFSAPHEIRWVTIAIFILWSAITTPCVA